MGLVTTWELLVFMAAPGRVLHTMPKRGNQTHREVKTCNNVYTSLERRIVTEYSFVAVVNLVLLFLVVVT